MYILARVHEQTDEYDYVPLGVFDTREQAGSFAQGWESYRIRTSAEQPPRRLAWQGSSNWQWTGQDEDGWEYQMIEIGYNLPTPTAFSTK